MLIVVVFFSCFGWCWFTSNHSSDKGEQGVVDFRTQQAVEAGVVLAKKAYI